MQKNNSLLNLKDKMPDWVTIREAIDIITQTINKNFSDSYIYRHALCGDICLSIYFQSPVFLRKVRVSNNKLKIRSVESSTIKQLCLVDIKNFLNGINLTFSTEGEYIVSTRHIIDTTLTGYEYVIIQRFLARTLNIPLPVTGANVVNYGISVTLSGEIFQAFEKITWQERIKHQIMQLPEDFLPDIDDFFMQKNMSMYDHKDYFPIYDLPQDACFVIRHSELEKLINLLANNKTPSQPSTRISTPLSRLFWLACKHNEAISPLIRQPYKLLSIFEQWASTDGITDHLSGDTLKTALERGAPTSL